MIPLAAMTVFTLAAAARKLGLREILAAPAQWAAVFAVIPLLLYNGKRGGGSARLNKWFFYIFYPAHIYALYILAYFLRR
jgi:hypothetical protein